MRQLLAHLPNRTRTLFRGDSGFFVGDLLDFLDEGGHGYLIKVKLKGLVSLLETQKWQKVKGQPAWEGCEFSHQCETWRRSRKFMAVRNSLTTRYAGWPFVVVTQYCAVGNRPPCVPVLSEWQENGRVALVNKN